MSAPYHYQMLGGKQYVPMTGSALIVLFCHVLFIAFFVFSPALRADPPRPRASVSVRLVTHTMDSAKSASPSAESKTPPAADARPVPQPPKEIAKSPITPIPVAAKPPEKQQPLKSTALARDLVQQLEKKPPETSSASVDTTSRPNLNDRLDQMRQDIRKKESAATSSTSVKSGTGSGTETGSTSQTGDRMAGIIDAYCHRAGAQIKRNWAFNEQLAGGNNTLMVKIAFKVMPNGDIVDIFFVDRSDNKHLNDSAYNAIVKSSPVSPHPPQIRQPYVQMGIEFTPKDIH